MVFGFITLLLGEERSERSKRNRILVHEMLLKPKTEVEFATLFRELIDDEMKFNMHFRISSQEFTIFASKLHCNLTTSYHIKNLFIVVRDLVYFRKWFVELGHLLVLHTICEEIVNII